MARNLAAPAWLTHWPHAWPSDGPAELWMVVTDRTGEPLAFGPIDWRQLQPRIVDGQLAMTGSLHLAVVQRYPGGSGALGEATKGAVLAVNQADGSFRVVFHITMAVPQLIYQQDRLEMGYWEWFITAPAGEGRA